MINGADSWQQAQLDLELQLSLGLAQVTVTYEPEIKHRCCYLHGSCTQQAAGDFISAINGKACQWCQVTY